MTIEKLFKIVNRLSPKERQNFTRYAKLGSSKKSLYVVLYERILECKSFDEPYIRGSEFSNSSKFAVYRKILIEKIIQSKVYFSEFSYSIRIYLFEGAKIGALDMVDDKFSREFQAALQRRDHHFALYLHSLRNQIADHCLHSIPLEPAWPSSRELLERVQDAETHQKMISEVRDLLTDPAPISPFEIAKMIEGIERLESNGRLQWEQIQKARIGIELLRKNFQAAFSMQKKLVEYLTQTLPDEPTGKEIREISYLIKLGIVVGERDLVVRYTLLLSGLEFRNLLFEEIQVRFWIMDTIAVADEYIDFRMAKETFETLMADDNGFSEKERGVLFYFVAKISFLSGNDAFALEVIHVIDAMTGSKTPQYFIFAKVLELLILTDGDDIDRIDKSLHTLAGMSKREGSDYLDFILQTVKVLTQSPIGEVKQILEDAQLEMDKVEVSTLQRNYFDFGLWLRAKAHKLPFSQMIEWEYLGKSNIAAIGY